ncbi:MAG: tetratricopeptide repeat protein [Bacteroidetes bacterium]|nr:tetratricopeptide repeat protein [Bacteroidota bacterium]
MSNRIFVPALITFISIWVSPFLFGQNNLIDSLKTELKKAPNDTSRCNILYQMTENEYDATKWPEYNGQLKKIAELNLSKNLTKKDKTFYLTKLSYTIRNLGDLEETAGNIKNALKRYDECLKISLDIGDKAGIAQVYNKYGLLYSNQNDMTKAFDYYNKSLEIKKELKDHQGMAFTYNNIGVIYYKQGNIPKALEYYEKSLHKLEDANDKRSVSQLLYNIATVYGMQGELAQGLAYAERCLKIRQELGDKFGIAEAYDNISSQYAKQKNLDKSTEFILKALPIYEELGDKKGIANAFNTLGTNNLKQGKNDLALEYYLKSLKLREEVNQKELIAFSLGNIGTTYLAQKKYDKALDYSLRSYKMSKEIGLPENLRDVSHFLSLIYKAQNNYQKAYEMAQFSTLMRDSITNETSRKTAIKSQLKYEYEKKSTADSVAYSKEAEIKEIQIAKQEGEIRAKRIQQYALFGGLLIVIVFAGFMFNRFKVTQKQKEIIEGQKEIVEEKNREITDSITYAKRIQSAILPPAKLVKQYLPESFVFYKPKDIVAGDFYWLEPKDGKILFAAADCTGHGVPGAMVSVVCNNALNRAVREYGLTEPDQILNKTREIVIEEFEKSEDDVKDGMDISLCALSIDSSLLQWAGANNPLWIIRKNAFEVEEIKANKQPIGKHIDQQPFDIYDLQLQKGDSIYIFTDGYQDQFGGSKGKKFKTSQLKEIILSMQQETMEKQKDILARALSVWKGNIEQVDDICIIGVRI